MNEAAYSSDQAGLEGALFVNAGHNERLTTEVIRLNQVIANHNLDFIEEPRPDERSVGIQSQRMVSWGDELWKDIKGSIVEFDQALASDSQTCSICLMDFNA